MRARWVSPRQVVARWASRYGDPETRAFVALWLAKAAVDYAWRRLPPKRRSETLALVKVVLKAICELQGYDGP